MLAIGNVLELFWKVYITWLKQDQNNFSKEALYRWGGKSKFCHHSPFLFIKVMITGGIRPSERKRKEVVPTVHIKYFSRLLNLVPYYFLYKNL